MFTSISKSLKQDVYSVQYFVYYCFVLKKVVCSLVDHVSFDIVSNVKKRIALLSVVNIVKWVSIFDCCRLQFAHCDWPVLVSRCDSKLIFDSFAVGHLRM